MELAAFVEEFVVPLLVGGTVRVRAPFSTRDRQLLFEDAGVLADGELTHARLRRARNLIADPPLDDPTLEDLSFWMGLHNILFFDHPDVHRVWARGIKWQLVELETRKLLHFAVPVDMGDALSRHLALGAMLELERIDTVVELGEGERRFIGQSPPRRLGLFGPAIGGAAREELVHWSEQAHAPVTQRLLADAFLASPLTSLLHPRFAPPGWTPLSGGDFLRNRAFARAVCHQWAARTQWVQTGASTIAALLRSLDVAESLFGAAPQASLPPAADAETDLPALGAAPIEVEPEVLGSVLGSLIHLHLLKVMELDARVGVGLGARDWAVHCFLAVPLLLERMAPVLGEPLAGSTDRALRRRFEEYRDHLRSLVPADVVENLVASVVSRVVEPVSR